MVCDRDDERGETRSKETIDVELDYQTDREEYRVSIRTKVNSDDVETAT